MPKISEMRDVCQLRKLNVKGQKVLVGHWFNVLITRHFSIYLTWLFIKLNISANTVTFFMIIFGLIAVPLLILHVFWLNIIGALSIMLAELLDCVDGEVARWNKKSSLRGLYLDLVCHSLCNGIVSSICALHLYDIEKKPFYLIMAFLAFYVSQSGYLLIQQFEIIQFQITQNEMVSSNKSNISTMLSSRWASLMDRKLLVFIIRFIYRSHHDHVLVRIMTIIAIFISYCGTNLPIIVMSYWVVVVGAIGLIAQIFIRYYFFIPKISHFRKTD